MKHRQVFAQSREERAAKQPEAVIPGGAPQDTGDEASPATEQGQGQSNGAKSTRAPAPAAPGPPAGGRRSHAPTAPQGKQQPVPCARAKRARSAPMTKASPESKSPPGKSQQGRNADKARVLFPADATTGATGSLITSFYDDVNRVVEVLENAMDEDDSADSDDDVPLAFRLLPRDYNIQMLAKSAGRSYAVTVAAGNDGCSFTFKLPGKNAVCMPMHFVEVLEVNLETNQVKWEFWIPSQALLLPRTKNTKKTFRDFNSLFEEQTFRRACPSVTGWYDFDASEILTCWDEPAGKPAIGGVPGGPEKAELLKVAKENWSSDASER